VVVGIAVVGTVRSHGGSFLDSDSQCIRSMDLGRALSESRPCLMFLQHQAHSLVHPSLEE